MDGLGEMRILHVAISLECLRPLIAPHLENIRVLIADAMKLPVDAVGLTASSGEGLTPFGKGEAIRAVAIVTATKLSNTSTG
jgi:2-C-methyl-D-erythritol 2,4-cyclodiphosphate synthase